MVPGSRISDLGLELQALGPGQEFWDCTNSSHSGMIVPGQYLFLATVQNEIFANPVLGPSTPEAQRVRTGEMAF